MNMREEFMSTTTIENTPKVTIILLNYNGWEDAIECLESVYKITYPNWELILVDNGSVDGSVSKIKEWAAGKIPVESKFFEYDAEGKPIQYIEELFYDEKEARVKASKKEKEWDMVLPHQKLSILRIEKNRGFTGGNNIGIEYILKERETDYILLLSNDTVVDPEFLGALVKVAESDEKIGIVGPKVFHYKDPEVLQSFGMTVDYLTGKIKHIGAGERDNHQFDETKEIDAIYGCVMLISRNVIDKVGGFDESFFTYVEELDLCLRVLKRGYKVTLSPEGKIYHKVRGSKGGKVTEELIFYRTRNYPLMIHKNFTKTFTFFSMIFYFIHMGINVVLLVVKFRDPKILLGFFEGIKASLVQMFISK